eukprot:TRINITY_DN699_c0_g1_i1.p1 TRINITY_DN699_c0_g1~~TRINITY_DN699_c0_g1_i1.p1  ORF type:complete len:1123 (+),score=243.15 TRINITY_DN699_c0_g1_i1:40-3408(+)
MVFRLLCFLCLCFIYANCLACLNTQYIKNGVCTNCDAGYYCDGFEKMECKNGTYSKAGSKTCLACPQGSYCISPCRSPVNCPIGTYSSLQSSTCIDCPSGSYCPSVATSTPILCAAGTYSLIKSSVCTRCPLGFACPKLNEAPIACAAGWYSLGGQTTCTECLAGYYCSETWKAPIICPKGTYSPAGVAACLQCPAGSFCDAEGIAAPSICPTGMYSSIGATACSTCPSGSYCTINSTTPVLCSAGTYSIGQSGSCSKCEGGTYSTIGSSNCTICPAGSFCSVGSSLPIQCGSGSFSKGGSENCNLCPEGTYSEAGASQCVNCSAGSYCPIGCSSPFLCGKGTFSDNNAKTCSLCPLGQYSEIGASKCTTCPAGSYCASANLNPVKCSSGFFSQAGSASCIQCPIGSYSNENRTSCETVQPGFYTDGKSAIACAPGTYSIVNGSSSCILCPSGSQCTATTIAVCSKGTYSTLGSGTCQQCPSGYYCPSNTSQPIPCNDGFLSDPGAYECYALVDNTTSVVICDSGYFQTSAGNCEICPLNYECPTMSIKKQCEEGTYALPGSISCVPCPEGYCCPLHGIPLKCKDNEYSPLNEGSCLICPAGYQCDGSKKTLCLKGYFSVEGSLLCTKCPDGFVCTDPTTLPTKCPAGYKCIDGGQLLCSSGTYSEEGSSTCKRCPPYYSCSNPAILPQLCPNGFTGINGSCVLCRENYYCVKGKEITCESGTFSIMGSSDCTLCPAGFWCTGNSNPQVCSVGKYSKIGASACTVCPYQHICTNPSELPVECPESTYSNTTSCLPCSIEMSCFVGSSGSCKAGWYFDKETNECVECPIDKYCPVGVAVPLSCPDGLCVNSGRTTCQECDLLLRYPLIFFIVAGLLVIAGIQWCCSHSPRFTRRKTTKIINIVPPFNIGKFIIDPIFGFKGDLSSKKDLDDNDMEDVSFTNPKKTLKISANLSQKALSPDIKKFEDVLKIRPERIQEIRSKLQNYEKFQINNTIIRSTRSAFLILSDLKFVIRTQIEELFPERNILEHVFELKKKSFALLVNVLRNLDFHIKKIEEEFDEEIVVANQLALLEKISVLEKDENQQLLKKLFIAFLLEDLDIIDSNAELRLIYQPESCFIVIKPC